MTAELNKKYANRVLHDVGLCICTFDLSQAGEGKVRYGDGLLWYKGLGIHFLIVNLRALNNFLPVVFRMVVFRPFVSEVIVAKVKSSDQEGIRRESAICVDGLISTLTSPDSVVTVGFFDDIYIPASYLPQPSALCVLYLPVDLIQRPIYISQRLQRTSPLLASGLRTYFNSRDAGNTRC